MNKNEMIKKIESVSKMWKISIVRELCINNDWFTGGDVKQYEKMFELIKYNYYDLASVCIWLCSNTEYTIPEIEDILIKEIYKTAVEMEMITE
jgi:hypothetical protein